MSKLSVEDVVKVAKMAQLSLSPEEILSLHKQLSETLDQIGVIASLEEMTKGEEATYQVTTLDNVFREDKVDTKRVLTQAEALGNSSNSRKGFFVVPGVFAPEG